MVLKAKKDVSRVTKLQKKLVKTQKALNLMLDKRLLTQFKAKTAMQGVSMTEVLELAIEKYVG